MRIIAYLEEIPDPIDEEIKAKAD